MVLFSFTFTMHYANEFHLQVTIYKVTFRHSAKLGILHLNQGIEKTSFTYQTFEKYSKNLIYLPLFFHSFELRDCLF